MKLQDMLLVFSIAFLLSCSLEQEASSTISEVVAEMPAVENSIQPVETATSVQVSILEDELEEPYIYLSEISVVSQDTVLADRLQNAIYGLSENTSIQSALPQERLLEKKVLVAACNDSGCDYIPEAYKILSNQNKLLNIEYQYNQHMSTDEWFKYAVFDTSTGQQLSYQELFVEPQNMLNMYETRYVAMIQSYLDDNPQEDDDQLDEYQEYLRHLEIREPFELTDLDNIELVYSSEQTLTAIRFHYQGQAGYSRQLFPNDFIEFSQEEISSLLSK